MHTKDSSNCQTSESKFVPFGQQINNFFVKEIRSSSKKIDAPLTKTKPLSPRLYTKERIRNDSEKIKSTEEIEYEKFLKMPKFKALPLDKELFKEPQKIEIDKSKFKPTIPIEFAFQTKSRFESKERKSVEEEKIEFKATLLNRNIFLKPDFVPMLGKSSCTKCKEFNFATDQRCKIINTSLNEESVPKSPVHISFGKEYTPTKPIGINFRTEERAHSRQEKDKEKLNPEEDPYKPFKARPMPDFKSPEIKSPLKKAKKDEMQIDLIVVGNENLNSQNQNEKDRKINSIFSIVNLKEQNGKEKYNEEKQRNAPFLKENNISKEIIN